MPRAAANGIEIEYDTFGDPDDPPLLLISGLGSQMVNWDLDFLQSFVDRGFFVIRFDNREVGLSTKADTSGPGLMGALAGEEVTAPFQLSDMAADAVSVLDHLGVEVAHVLGVSMGGMIAQSIVTDHPDRVRSLTSIMSTTGDPDVGHPQPEVLTMMLEPTPTERDASIARSVEVSRTIGSPEHFEEDRARARAERAFDRAFYPQGVANQILAIITSGSRSEALAAATVPTLVIHGDADPLIDVSGGHRTAEVIPGAELMVLEGMGHDLPSVFWPTVIENITQLASRASIDA